jgi:hypothetical protein
VSVGAILVLPRVAPVRAVHTMVTALRLRPAPRPPFQPGQRDSLRCAAFGARCRGRQTGTRPPPALAGPRRRRTARRGRARPCTRPLGRASSRPKSAGAW